MVFYRVCSEIGRGAKWLKNNYVGRVRKLVAIVRGAVAFNLWRVGPLKRYTARHTIRIGLKSVRSMCRTRKVE